MNHIVENNALAAHNNTPIITQKNNNITHNTPPTTTTNNNNDTEDDNELYNTLLTLSNRKQADNIFLALVFIACNNITANTSEIANLIAAVFYLGFNNTPKTNKYIACENFTILVWIVTF